MANKRPMDYPENTNPAGTEEFIIDSTANGVESVKGSNIHKGMTPASQTVASVIEIANTAEIDAGVDASRAISVDQFVASKRNVRLLEFSLVASKTDVAVEADIGGDWPLQFSGTILQDDTNKHLLKATNTTPGVDGTMIVDIKLNGTSIMTTNKLDIETGEKTTVDAATQPDLTTTAFVAGDILTWHITAIHSTTPAKGLKGWMAIRES